MLPWLLHSELSYDIVGWIISSCQFSLAWADKLGWQHSPELISLQWTRWSLHVRSAKEQNKFGRDLPKFRGLRKQPRLDENLKILFIYSWIYPRNLESESTSVRFTCNINWIRLRNESMHLSGSLMRQISVVRPHISLRFGCCFQISANWGNDCTMGEYPFCIPTNVPIKLSL